MKKIIILLILIHYSPVDAGVAILLEGSNDYQVVTAEEETYGKANIASMPIPSYTAQLSFALFYRLGLRLRYKMQESQYIEPDEKPLRNSKNTLHNFASEFAFQISTNLQSYLKLERKDRLLLSMKNPTYLELSKVPTSGVGLGFIWETENRVGIRYGFGSYLSYVNFDRISDEEINLDNGFEFGANLKLSYLTRSSLAYFAKGYFTTGQFFGNTYTFSLSELSMIAGISFYWGY